MAEDRRRAEDDGAGDEQAAARQDDGAGEAQSTGETPATGETSSDDAAAPEREAAPAPAPARTRRRGGVMGPIVGGVIAAVIGFVFALWLGYAGAGDLPGVVARNLPFGLGQARVENAERIQAVEARLDEVSGSVAAVDERLAGYTPPVTEDSLQSAISDSAARLGGRMDDLGGRIDRLATRVENLAGKVDGFGGRLDALDDRVTAVEARPIGEAADVSAATEAFRNQIDAMRNELSAQQERNQETVTEIESATDQAMARIEDAAGRVRALERQAAVTRLEAAVEAGAPFASALTSLDAGDVPAVLTENAEGGAPGLEALKAGFDEPAREALSAALGATVEGGPADRVRAFLQSQLQARPMTPQEGSDPGAILSRARAAVQAGRLQEALDEIKALPEPGRQALSGWTARARERIEALDAVRALTRRIEQG